MMRSRRSLAETTYETARSDLGSGRWRVCCAPNLLSQPAHLSFAQPAVEWHTERAAQHIDRCRLLTCGWGRGTHYFCLRPLRSLK